MVDKATLDGLRIQRPAVEDRRRTPWLVIVRMSWSSSEKTTGADAYNSGDFVIKRSAVVIELEDKTRPSSAEGAHV